MSNQFFHIIRRGMRSLLVYAGALFIIQIALAAVFKQAGAGLPGGMGMLIDLLPDAVRGFVGSSELDLLTANGNLIKRPFLIGPDCGNVGFAAKTWDRLPLDACAQ